MRQQEKKNGKKQVEPTSAWLFNTIANRHASAMDNFPAANILAREEGDKDEISSFASGIADMLKGLYDQAYWAYRPLTEDICSRLAPENEVDLFLDQLLDYAGYEPCFQLFEKVCKRYQDVYPEVVDMHIKWYHEEIEDGGIDEQD